MRFLVALTVAIIPTAQAALPARAPQITPLCGYLSCYQGSYPLL